MKYLCNANILQVRQFPEVSREIIKKRHAGQIIHSFNGRKKINMVVLIHLYEYLQIKLHQKRNKAPSELAQYDIKRTETVVNLPATG